MKFAQRRWLPWLLAAACIVLAGCTASAPASPTPSRPAPSGGSGEQPSAAGPAYQLQCFYPGGEPAGTYTSLDAVWASVPFVKMDHCVATFVAQGNATPVGPTQAEVGAHAYEALREAAAQLPGKDLAAVYLQVLAVCARIPPAGGPHGVASYPIPILHASLHVCPHAPGSAIVHDYLEGAGDHGTEEH